MPQLKVVRPNEKPHEVPLETDEFLVGRSSQCDLSLDDRWLSRRHARFVKQGEHYFEDQGSRNGTFLNEQEVSRRLQLSHGDVIRVGDVQIHFLDSAEARVEFTDLDTPLTEQTVRLDTSSLDLRRIHAAMRAEEGPTPVVATSPLWPVLNEAAATLIAHYPRQELLEVILDLVFRAISPKRAAILLREEGAPEGLRLAAQRAEPGEEPLRISRRIIAEVTEKRHAVSTLDASSDSRFSGSESLQIQGIRSLLCVPLWSQKEVLGLIYADTLLPGKPFADEDLQLMGLLANMAAVKLENSRLVEAELESRRLEEQLSVAAQIQRKLLPDSHPQPRGYELSAMNRSCYEIGGDTYDLLERDDGRLSLVIADVAGKGVPAALLMAVFQVSVRTLVRTEADPVALAQRLNMVMLDNSPTNKYVTAFYGELDPATHRFTYVNAGHNPPILLGSEGPRELEATGPVLGVVPHAPFRSGTLELATGDLLCLYTDGVTETIDVDETEFGPERLVTFLEEQRDGDIKQLPEMLWSRLRDFGGEAEPVDDTTVVMLRRV